jgi:hypothetical protein
VKIPRSDIPTLTIGQGDEPGGPPCVVTSRNDELYQQSVFAVPAANLQ